MMPGGEPARRRADLECLRGDRPQCELGEQIAAGRDDDAGKADAQQALRDEVGVLQAVQDGEQDGAAAPRTSSTRVSRHGAKKVLRWSFAGRARAPRWPSAHC